MKANQEVSQSAGLDTSREVVQRPNYLAALDRYAADYDREEAARKAAAAAQPGLDSSVLAQEMRNRANLDAAALAEIEDTQAAIGTRPDLFGDGNISEADAAEIRGAKDLTERLSGVRSNFRRRNAFLKAKQAFLNRSDLAGLKPETLNKITEMYDIKFADEPLKASFGEEVFKTVMEQTGGKGGALDFALEAARRKQVADIKYGEETGGVTESMLRNEMPALLDVNVEQDLAEVVREFNSIGAVLPDTRSKFQAKLDGYVQELRAKAMEASANARKSGQIIDLKGVYDEIDKKAAVLGDLTKKFGVDPDFTDRMNELHTAMGKAPILAVGTDFTKMVEVMQSTGYPTDVVINLLQEKPEKMREILIRNGLPPLTNDTMSEFAKRLTAGIHSMATMDSSKLGDPSLARFQQYLAGMWAGSKKGAPKQAVVTHLKTLLDSPDPVQTGVYFAQNPALAANVDLYTDTKAQYVAAARNGAILMMAEMEKSSVRIENGRVTNSSYGGAGTGSRIPQAAPENITTGVKAWQRYLNSPEALRMLGPELRDEFNAIIEGRSAEHGYSTDRIQRILPTVDQASDLDLETHSKGISKTLFRTKKSDPQYQVLQQAKLAIDSEIESRKPAKEPAPKKTEPQVRWKPPSPAVTAKLKAQYDPLIDKYAAEYDVPAELAKAIALQESKYDPNAVSEAGAKGLMQLMDATSAALGLADDDVFDPEQNIRAGIEHLARLYNRVFKKGDYPESERLEMVVAAYNAGEGTVKRAMQGRTWAQAKAALPKDETRDYISKVRK